MQAVVMHTFGDPRQLKIEEIPTPDPKNDEVLVAVDAASINPSDVKNVAGAMHGTTLPRVPGRDFSGVVARGPAELVGREVWGTGGDIGFTRDGSHAAFLLLPRSGITAKPAALSMELAGAAGLTFVTAWSAMVTAAGIAAGERAVIIGAAGGVGAAALQIAKGRGARVIAVVRLDSDAASARAMGADVTINSASVNVVDTVHALTDGRGSEVVFDTSGMMFAEAVEAAAMDARIPVIAAPKDGTVTFSLRTVYRKTLRVAGIDTRRLDVVACAKLLQEMAPYFDSGRFTVPPVESFPLGRAVDAYLQAAHGGHRIVLRPNQQRRT